uniref:GATOR complex protein MIO zinc-ribbon like domain-containing protein n=1 Tax=Ditylenchus dipsaci TaxID=166011 RepID=A0A915EHD8_9BILA
MARKISHATPITQQQTQARCKFVELASYFDQPDQSVLMKARINQGYGYGNTSNSLYTIIESSRNVIENDPYANEDIQFCWRWVHRMYHYPDDLQKTYLTRFPGIKHIIKDMKSSSTTRNDEITYRNRVFTNEKRETILRICGWPSFEDRTACKLMFDELMNRPKVESKTRACALAMFSVQGANSKEYLQRLCDFTHSEEFVEKNEKEFVDRWKKMALRVTDVLNKFNGIKVPDYELLCNEISDSYLLAIIKFLARREFYNAFLHEIISLENMELEDKLAFAAIHMDDESLNIALDNLLGELRDQRPLSALLITGLDDHNECHQVLHRYVDEKNDIQTASILFVVGNCFRKSKLLQDSSFTGVKISELLSKAIDAEERRSPRRRSMHCVRDYMEMLNNWCFWLPKTFLSSLLPQAVIACNFCGVPIYPSVSDKIESLRSNVANTNIYNYPKRGDKTRMMSCGKCKRPLPKCTICRQHYGSQASASKPEVAGTTSKNSAIDHWFVWCCSCNHGGHLSHIRDWFQEYKACPASGCDCLCMDRDHSLRDDLIVPFTNVDI